MTSPENNGENNKTIVIKQTRSPDYNCIYAVGAMGGNYGPYDLRIHFYDVEVEVDTEAKPPTEIQTRTLKTSVILSYAAAKQLSEWLKNHLEHYEKESGRPIFTGENARENKETEDSQS